MAPRHQRTHTTGPPESVPAQPWTLLAVLCLVQFLLTFDDTAVNVAIPGLITDLGFSTSGVTWVANAYFLTFGGFLLLGGRVGDVFGRRRVFLIGLGVFGAASMASGFAQTPGQLVAGRLIQGAGAAVVSPSALALIALQYPDERARARAFSVWGAVAGAGGVSGLVLAGLLIDTTSWRWVFLVNPPIVIAVMFVVARLVDERRAPHRSTLDVAGAVVGTAAVTAMIFALVRAADDGWIRAGSIVPAIVSLALVALFVRIERRTANPLVPFWFVSFPPRAIAMASNLVFSAAFFALSFLLMLHLQRVLGYSALEAAIAYLPHGIALLAGVAVSSIVLEHFGVRRTLTAAMVIGAAGMVLLGSTILGDDDVVSLLPGIVITGFASGLGFPVLAVAALLGIDDDNAGLGSALLSSSQQLGGAVGLAVFANIATRSAAAHGAVEGLADGISEALIGVGVALTVGAVIASRLPRTARSDPHDSQMQQQHKETTP